MSNNKNSFFFNIGTLKGKIDGIIEFANIKTKDEIIISLKEALVIIDLITDQVLESDEKVGSYNGNI